MPVLATITAITLLRGSDSALGPFFDAAKLRERLTDGLEGVADDQLEESLAIAVQLDSQLKRYRASVDASTDAYIQGLSDPATDAADLISRLEPIDRERRDVIDAVIAYRRQLIGVLDESNWAAVFE